MTNQLLQYGMPSFEAITHSRQSSFLDNIFLKFSEEILPTADSETVKNELLEILPLTEQLSKDELLISRYRLYDRSISQYVAGFSFPENDETTKNYRRTIENIFADIFPVIFKLKLKYQRARPFQVCSLHDIKLYPFSSLSAHSPAFPSMHSTAGYVLANVCGNKWPQTYQYYKDLAEDVFQSRMYMGVCLPSDVEAGKRLAQYILDDKEFKVKYGL